MPGKVCVLVSGGLDSAALVGHYLSRGLSVQPLYVSGGLRWEPSELRSIRRFLRALPSPKLKPLRVLRLDQSDLYPPRHWALNGRVPAGNARWTAVKLEGRNLLLLAKGGALCASLGIPRLALAILRGNPFLDARPRFLRAMEGALRLGLGRRIRVEAPFSRLPKPEVIRRHRDLPLERTFSCLEHAGALHCGACSKCIERRRAFARARVPDRTPYRRNSAAKTFPSSSQVRK